MGQDRPTHALFGAINTLYRCRKLAVVLVPTLALLHPVWLAQQNFRNNSEDLKEVEKNGWGIAETPEIVTVSLAQQTPSSEHLGLSPAPAVERARVKTTSPLLTRTQELVRLQKQIVAACLVLEAGGEKRPVKGMAAVMNVIQNRAKGNPAYFYNAVKVPQQFSCFDDVEKSNPRNFFGMIAKASRHDQWENACRIVELACANELKDITGGALHYLNPKTATDKSWQGQLKNKITIGQHVFGIAPLNDYLRGLKSAPLVSEEAFRKSAPTRTIAPEGLQ